MERHGRAARGGRYDRADCAGAAVRLRLLSPPAVRRILFLPGASGDGRFWHPVAERLPVPWEKTFLDWPGLGHVPSHPGVNGLADLAQLVLDRAGAGAVDLVAQSMGGVVAMLVALARPGCVRRIVLTATSGGIDVAPFEPEDWRPAFAQEYPGAVSWILTARPNLAADCRR